MRRTSSSTPYSRSWSNSVPPPRPLADRRPTSRIRARLMRSSASSRLGNGGWTRSRSGRSSRRWRAPEPERPLDPHDQVADHEAAPAARAERGRRPEGGAARDRAAHPAGRRARSDGASSSASATRTRPVGGVAHRPRELALAPQRDHRRERPVDVESGRVDRQRQRRPATTSSRTQVRRPAGRGAARRPGSPAPPAPAAAATAGGATGSGTGDSSRARAPWRGRRRARRRRWRPRAPPRAAAGRGGAGRAWRWPSPRRA